MKRLALMALLALAPLTAQAQLQFDTSSSGAPAPDAPGTAAGDVASQLPGLMWLQRTPMSLFDLGMMELTQAANKSAGGLFDITGAVAEYQASKGLVVLSFFARTAYSEPNCEFVINKLRDSMFPKRDNPSELASDLGSYFSSYGPTPSDRPPTIGAELVRALRFAVFMPGGACQMPLYGSDTIDYWKDPNAPAPQMPANGAAPAAQSTPQGTPQSTPQSSAPKPAPSPAQHTPRRQ